MTTDILELPEVRERIPRISVEAYEKLPERNENGRRTELLRGIVIEKRPSTPLHCYLAHSIYERLNSAVPKGKLVRQNGPLRFQDSMPEPDVTVVSGSLRDFWEQHPRTADLAIEIATGTLAIDRANAPLYAENEVREYWIVDPGKRCVEIYRRPQNGNYYYMRIHQAEEDVRCESVPEIVLNLAEIWREE
jgi:Uma2 family endonuclease